MVFLHLLIQVVACVTVCNAFYPYQPVWREETLASRSVDNDDNGNGAIDRFPNTGAVAFELEQRAGHLLNQPAAQAERDAGHLTRRYGGPRLSVTQTDATPLVKRTNKYHIQEAVAPDQPLTVGIDQDGTDYAYFVKVHLGSKDQQLYMLLDTGAASSWVMGSDCTDKACASHDTYDFGASDTFRPISDEFRVSYGSGSVNGRLVSDQLSVAGVSFNYTFGLAKTTSADFLNFPFDGILGFSMSHGSNDNFLEKLTEAHKLDKNIFCITLNRAADGQNRGEVRFGSIDADRFTGDISYTPLSSQDGEWAIEIDDIGFDGKKAGVGQVKSFIDTGTSYMFGPMDKVAKVHSLIPGARSDNGKVYTVPCDIDKPVAFTFSGVDYHVWPQDWVSPKNAAGQCTSNIYGHDVASGSWLLGDSFLMNVYSVFDKDKKRIGFAQLAGSNTEASKPSDFASTEPAGSITAISTASTKASATARSIDSQPTADGATTVAAGRPEAPSAVDTAKPKETSDSAASGGYAHMTARVVAAAILGALVVRFV